MLPTKVFTSSAISSETFSAVVFYHRSNIVEIICRHNACRNFCSSTPTKGTVVPKDEVKRYIVDCMVKVGTPKQNADQLADVLLAADLRGHYSHGLNRLGMKIIFF